MIEQGDLVLAPFPFSDQSGRKIRPAIVVSNKQFNNFSEDVIVVGVTSNMIRNKYTLDLTNSDLDFGTLTVFCCIKPENIMILDKSLIKKRIGKVKKNKMKAIFDKITGLIEVK